MMRRVFAVAGYLPVIVLSLLCVVGGCGDDDTTNPPASNPVCQITPDSLAFGDVEVGETKDLPITIKNTGGGTLSGVVSEECPVYSIASGGGSYALTAGQEKTVTVRFAPMDEGEHSCVVGLGATACGPVTCIGVGTVVDRPILVVSPNSLDIGADRTDLTFTITNNGTGTLAWTATDDQPWLRSVVPGSGSTTTETDSVTVTVDRSGLNPGNYSGTVTVTPGTGSPQTVAVTMSVPAAPTLVLSTHSLDFGSSQASLPFTITNGGTGTLTWAVSDNQAWLSVSPTSGSTTTETDSVTVTVDRTGLSAGNYSGTVTVTPGIESPQTVAVTMSVSGGGGGGGFVLVQPGTFTMGSPADEPGRDSNETQHAVTLTKAFYVATTEVTQSDWQSVMGWNDSAFPGANRPVEQVTWYDCVSYCNQRSTRDGYTPAYTITNAGYNDNHMTSATVTWNQGANGYRLLTEAEWEYACRATSQAAFCNGTITNIYCSPLDPNLDQVGWYCGNAGSTTHDVGGKAANAWGLKDMHGNVYEWCWDRYATYPAGPVTDPAGPASGSFRVARGGSWLYSADICRSAYRIIVYLNYRGSILGLRLARTAP